MATSRFSCSFLLASVMMFSAYAQDDQVFVQRDNSKIVIRNRTGVSSFDVETRGKIELTDDDRDVKSMSLDGYLEIKKTVFGSRRVLLITNEGGTLKKEYYEGRTKIDFEPDGKAWLSEILPELVRSTTIAAEGRVERFFKKGGPNAVLSEIDRLESNHVKAHYANLLMKRPINQKDYPRIIDELASTIDSNHYLAGFLKDNLDKFIKSKEALEAAFRATSNMDSDHYRTEVIKQGLEAQPVSLDAVKIIMKSAGEMDSDHYKTEVLSSLLRQDNLNDEVVQEMIITSRTIDSDYYRSVVLNKALNKDGLSNASFQRALESIKDIDSDHYKTEVLKSLMSKPIPVDLQLTLIDLTGSIDSDHYCTLVLEEMMERQKIETQVLNRLISRASYLDSDHYSSMVMKDALSRNVNEEGIISILQAAERIDSDHYLTEVLTAAAPKVRDGSSALKDAYRSAAHRITSETYYGRAMRALDPN
ncbi:MAG: hypothetical protein AB7O48_10365 [Cyclobacteriaceae bacterium]